MIFNHFSKIFVNISYNIDNFIIWLIYYSLFNYILKHLLLVSWWNSFSTAESFCYKFTIHFFSWLYIVKQVVNICTSVIKGREHKAHTRWFNNPISCSRLNRIIFFVVAKTSFRKIYRAKTAYYILKNFWWIVHCYIVFSFCRHIICIIHKKNKVVTYIVKFINYKIVKIV